MYMDYYLTFVELVLLFLQDALMEPSGFKEAAVVLKDVWKSVLTMSGAQCVMIHGVPLMLEWHVDSWDCPLLVKSTLSVDHVLLLLIKVLWL